MDNKIKLTVELIPKTCHFSNVRTMVKSSEWDKIRHISYNIANHKCEICQDTGLNQGYKHPVECHEVWDYDDTTKVQKLIKLVSLCVLCHQVKHIGRAMAMGRQTICFRKLAVVNKWTRPQIDAHIIESFAVYKERSQHEWTLDLSILNQAPYNLDIKLDKKRIFEVKKYKKKKKRKPKATTPINKRPPKI